MKKGINRMGDTLWMLGAIRSHQTPSLPQQSSDTAKQFGCGCPGLTANTERVKRSGQLMVCKWECLMHKGFAALRPK